MSKFKYLYEYCQTLTPKVSRELILPKIHEITGVENVRTIKSGLDITVTRGYFLSAQNKENHLVRQFGCNLIVLARDQNKCWERFVNTKEMMHLFDEDGEPTSTPEELEKLLTDFEMPSATEAPSHQTISERKGFWMALACLCPEKSRIEFKSLRDKGHIDNYGIALQLRIPEQYVPLLFQSRYRMIVDALIA